MYSSLYVTKIIIWWAMNLEELIAMSDIKAKF